MSKLSGPSGLGGRSILHISSIRQIESPPLEDKRLLAGNTVAGLPAQINDEDEMCGGRSPESSEGDAGTLEDIIDRSIPLSSLAWEAYELSSDLSKSLKGDHGILAALDLSLPLPMCNVDLSSPTKPRDVLDIFGDVMDLPLMNNFVEGRTDTGDNNVERCDTSCDADGLTSTSTAGSTNALCVSIGPRSTGELDRSNTLMTPQELERMPDQGLEFEQSVGPKESPAVQPASPLHSIPTATEPAEGNSSLLCSGEAPVVLSQSGSELTAITVLTSLGTKTFEVNTEQLKQAAGLMQPVIINSEVAGFTLVMMPVSKMNLLPAEERRQQATYAKFKCLYCERKFERSYKLRLHEMMKHTLQKPHKCHHPGCSWAFSDAYRLRNHERCHLKLKPYNCPECGKSYTSYWNMQSHLSQMHDANRLQFSCESCEEAFTTETKLYKHISDKHPEQPKRFKCEENGCNAMFHSKMGLMRHMVGHKKREALNLTCPIEGCGRTFNWKSRLDVHLRTHTGEANFKCTYQGCGAAFASASILNRHKKIHSTNKKLTCSICQKSFHRLDHMRNHEQSHSAVRPFPCPEPGCVYAATTKRSLECHLKRHAIKANRARLVCPSQTCGQTFSTMRQLLTHINAHHPLIMEVRYAKELAEANQELQTEETLMATESVAETAVSETTVVTAGDGCGDQIAWDMQRLVPNVSYDDTMAVINAEVAGKSIELILPVSSNTKTNSSATAITSSRSGKLKHERGSARTDSLLNQRVCAKARDRQEKQKAQPFSNLDSTTAEVIQIDSKSSRCQLPTDVVSSSGSNECSANIGSVASTPLSSELLVSSGSGSMSSIPSSLEWLSSGQDGEDVEANLLSAADIIYTVPTTQLPQLAEQIDGGSAFTQLYDSSNSLSSATDYNLSNL